jgi:regulator of protease activity HflC (stomatin/prohibitin superfamily)
VSDGSVRMETTSLLASTLLILLGVLAFGVVRTLTTRLRGGGAWFVTVMPWASGLLYRKGAFVRVLPPGRHFVGLAGQVFQHFTSEQIVLIPAQDVMSQDGFALKLGAVVRFKITDVRRAQEAHANGFHEPLRVAAQMAMRDAAATRTLDDLIAARTALDAEMAASIRPRAAELGLEILGMDLRDLILPAEIRRLLTEPERARREGLAALERARGEQAALRSLANAARLLRNNPELQNLRVLQALNTAPGKTPPTLVLGAGQILPVRMGEASAQPEPDETSPA